MREIGSEFWPQHASIVVENTDNEAYLLSGRTALRFIIDDICRNHVVRNVLLPSYCCEAMIQPFVQSGINVQFYQVYVDRIDYPYDNGADIVLLIDFFGYVIDQNAIIAQQERQKGKIVIYDFTHKLDGNLEVQGYADYSFCSYRKWFYCNFAKVIKHHGKLGKVSSSMRNERYIRLRDEAAYEKKKYIVGLTSDKDVFLSKFNSAEQILSEDYIGYAGVPLAFNVDDIVSKRRENATCLIMGLNKLSQIDLWRKDLQLNDTPMFVPVLVDPLVRDDLRSYLISKKIYCPIHWPKLFNRHMDYNLDDELYDMELSLVCDQRYDIADMERIIQVINDFFE